MKYKVVILPKARIAMNQAVHWYLERSRSESVASHWLEGLLAKLASLSQFPERCPLARESEDFGEAIRELHYGSGRRTTHRALFRILGDVVEVMTVRHVAQDDVSPEEL
jgi:plasmid stabilization system protein ParE